MPTNYDVALEISGTKYELTLARIRGAYRKQCINDFAPKTARGALDYSHLSTWNVIAQEDFRHGFGHRRFKDEAGYHRTTGSIDTRHKDVVQLATRIVAADYYLPAQAYQMLDFGSAIYACFDGTATGSELLSNTGFETAGAGGADVFGSWSETTSTGNSAIEDEGTIVDVGSHACKATGNGSEGSTYVGQSVTVTGGERYKLSFETRGAAGQASGEQGDYGVWDATNSAWITSWTATGVAGDSETYTTVTHSFTAPATCTSVTVDLAAPSEDNKVSYYDTVSTKRTPGGIRKATSVSSGWSLVTDSDVVDADVYCLLSNGAYMFAGIDGGQVLKSSDGASWTTTGVDANAADYRFMALGGGKLWAAKDDDNHVHWATSIDASDWEGDDNDTNRVTVGPGDPSGTNTATPITGMQWFNGGLHVAREDGLWVIPESDPSTAYRLLDWSNEQRSTNGKGMVVWKDRLIIPKGPQILAFTGTGVSDITPPSIGRSFPYTSYGNFETLACFGPYLYVAAQEGESETSFVALRPNAAGTNTNLTPSDASSNNYEMVDETTPDYFGTYSHTGSSASYVLDTYNIGTSTNLTGKTITKVTVYALVYGQAAYNTYAKVALLESGQSISYGPETTLPVGQWRWAGGEWTTKPSGGAFSKSTVDDLEIGVAIRNDGGIHSSVSYVSAIVEYSDDISYRLLCWDGGAWHNLGSLDAGGKCLYVSPATNALWVNDYDDDNGEYTSRYMQLQQYSFLPDDDYPASGTHTIEFSRLDAGLRMVDKCWHEWQIHSDNLTSNRYLTAYYRISGDTWTSLGNVTESPYQAIDLGDIEAKYLDLRLDFVTDVNAQSPILEGWAVEHLPRPDTMYGYAITVQIADNMMAKDSRTRREYTAAEVESALTAARDSKIPVTFTDIFGNEIEVFASSITEPDWQPVGEGGRWVGLVTLNLAEPG